MSVKKILIILSAPVVVIVDQIIKYLVVKEAPFEGGFLISSEALTIKLEFVKNYFFVFGVKMPQLLIWFLVVIIVIVLLVFLWRSFKQKRFSFGLSLAVIVGAAISNLIDRTIYDAVIDYVSISFGSFQWPVFNLADAMILVGVIALIIIVFKNNKK